MNEHGTFLVQVCDVVLGQPAFNWEEITELCQIGQYKRLPAPLCLKEEPSIPYTMQLIILKEDDDTHTVLKHLIFAPNKMHVTAIKRFCYGQAMQISYGKNFQTGSVAVQYMMERLGGFQVRYYTLTPKAVAKTHPDRDVRKKGYTFIRERGPGRRQRVAKGSLIGRWSIVGGSFVSPGGPWRFQMIAKVSPKAR